MVYGGMNYAYQPNHQRLYTCKRNRIDGRRTARNGQLSNHIKYYKRLRLDNYHSLSRDAYSLPRFVPETVETV